jgi:hypothetical protein
VNAKLADGARPQAASSQPVRAASRFCMRRATLPPRCRRAARRGSQPGAIVSRSLTPPRAYL